MGADVAAWKQAARVDAALAAQEEYVQALLDLVKVYERIPHWVLLREAPQNGYQCG